MNWRLKCLAFHALDLIPGGDALHQWAQQHITGRYFRTIPASAVTDPQSGHLYHANNYRRLGRPGVALEFGAGGSLSTALLLSAAGATVYAYDIQRLANTERVNHVIRRFRELNVPGQWPEVRSMDDLQQHYRIHYRAPGDARATGLPPRSVDYIYSMSCLEHIPPADIEKILIECKRIASDDALLSFWIGYFDHYATADKSITRCNFYRYNDEQWRFWNPPRHFHNRLRHGDFEELFSGFEVLGNERIMTDERVLDDIPIDKKFAVYSKADLLTTMGKFLLAIPRPRH